MNLNSVEILNIRNCAYNVLHVKTSKPEGYTYSPGQAAKVFIDQFKWRNEGRFYAFASIPNDDYLEFLVKTNMKNDKVVNKILNLQSGDKLIVTDPIGNLEYKGEGIFIAKGVGISPFISIFKNLKLNKKIGRNKLIYFNKKQDDILFNSEFKQILGNNFTNIVEEKTQDYRQGQISQAFLKEFVKNPSNYFYLCGTPSMIKRLKKYLINLSVEEQYIIY